MNPGDTASWALKKHIARPLNEGRGMNPGDTHEREAAPRGIPQRSTKAGA